MSLHQAVRTVCLLGLAIFCSLPGIVLAIACPERDFVLLDSSSKKLRFVQQTLGILKLENVTLENTRVEEYQPDVLFDTIISRAFSDLPDFYKYSVRLCSDNGQMLAMKGVYPMTEIECMEDKSLIDDVVALKVPGLDAERHLVVMHAAEDTQAAGAQ